ncbi:centromere protein U isoform X4 [Channa argus]|uniref:centromere protein U isoform X4 n=1 Tax=Channa argus TaxID=215402 RepID=UPI003520F06D
MSAKKRRGAKVPTQPQDERGKAPPFEQSDLSSLSTIDKASFLEGLQQNYGNPLHSTAMEEDLNVLEEAQKAGRKNVPLMVKSPDKQRGAAAKRKQTETDCDIVKGAEKRRRSRCTGETVKSRPVKNKRMKQEKNRETKSSSGKSSDPQSQESEPDAAQQRRGIVLSSEEEGDEDASWNPSPKKAKVYSLGRTRKSLSNRSKSRKSSSGSSADPDNITQQRMIGVNRHGNRGRTDLEVVLDTFLDFCEQYRESVESKAVKQSIDSFSNNVKEQLLEKICSYKSFRVVKRENAKVGSLIRKKSQKLVDAKHELMKAERQVWLAQKEKAELELRLADLRRGHAFLHGIRELNRQYLDYREKHPKEKEMYGTSSLPALIVETKYRQTPEHQLRGLSDQLGKGLKSSGAPK